MLCWVNFWTAEWKNTNLYELGAAKQLQAVDKPNDDYMIHSAFGWRILGRRENTEEPICWERRLRNIQTDTFAN